MYLAILSKEQPSLAAYELACAGHFRTYALIDDEILIFRNRVDLPGLAYTKSVYCIISSGQSVRSLMQKAAIRHCYQGPYACRTYSTTDDRFSEKEFGSLIWRNLRDPAVDLKNPKTAYWLIQTKKRHFLCVPIWENTDHFEVRKAHHLPALHPTAMHPKLARALVNILGKESFLDPFCGAGGILIEGALAGCIVSGSDIDPGMIARAKKNLSHLDISAHLEIADAAAISKKVAGIITDLPYGRNSRINDLRGTYLRFMQAASSVTRRMIVCFPSSIDVRLFLEGWRIEKQFEYYLHRSLSKRILVLVR